jgi:hypothetical protein
LDAGRVALHEVRLQEERVHGQERVERTISPDWDEFLSNKRLQTAVKPIALKSYSYFLVGVANT